MRRVDLVAIGLLSSIWASPAWADTVVLANGDQLTGKVLLMDSGKLVLKTDYAGEIRISWDKVVQLKTDDPVLLRTQNLPAGYEARLVSATEPGKVGTEPIGASSAATHELALADIRRIVRPHPFYGNWSFKGGVDVAMDATHSTSSNQNWNAALHLTAQRNLWRHGLKLDYVRKTQNSVVGTYNYDAIYTADRFLSEKLFVRGRLRYGSDRIDNPQQQLVFATGPGYQFWDNELGAFSVSAMLTHTRYKYQDDTRDQFQSAGLSWNYTRNIAGKQWQLFTNGEVYRALGTAADYNFEAELGLRYSVTQWMSLYAKTSYNRVAAQNQPTTSEHRYSLGLGVHW